MKNITRKLAAGLFVLSLATATIHAGDIGIPSRPIQLPPPVNIAGDIGNPSKRLAQIPAQENGYLEQIWPSLTQALVALF